MERMTIREIEHGILKRKFPDAVRYLVEGETLLAGSFRKVPLLFGCSLAFIGLFLLGEGISFAVRGKYGIVPVVAAAGALLLLLGYDVLFVKKKEYLFITDTRVVHVTFGMTGKRGMRIIPIGQIEDARLLRDVALFKNSTSGQISLHIKGRKTTALLPNLTEATSVYEELRTAILSLGHV